MYFLNTRYPFSAGKTWTKIKTWIFNHFFTQLEISYTWQKPRNIEFIKDLDHLEGLVIESHRSFDLTPLSKCSELTYLNIGCQISKDTRVDLSSPPLDTYLGRDEMVLRSIYKTKSLRKITITGYGGRDLQAFETQSIERITINGSTALEGLTGIEKLPNLKLVEIERCPSLKRAAEFAFDYPNIQIYVDGKNQ